MQPVGLPCVALPWPLDRPFCLHWLGPLLSQRWYQELWQVSRPVVTRLGTAPARGRRLQQCAPTNFYSDVFAVAVFSEAIFAFPCLLRHFGNGKFSWSACHGSSVCFVSSILLNSFLFRAFIPWFSQTTDRSRKVCPGAPPLPSCVILTCVFNCYIDTLNIGLSLFSPRHETRLGRGKRKPE